VYTGAICDAQKDDPLISVSKTVAYIDKRHHCQKFSKISTLVNSYTKFNTKLIFLRISTSHGHINGRLPVESCPTSVCRTGKRKDIREMAFARGNLSSGEISKSTSTKLTNP
jgi:hypothetical protein